jgi:glutathione S-transferase
MTTLILHAYDASPFTQRALAMLGLKRLEWRWVETPMAPPKDDLVALTGGYRGTPVLQIGADIYIDSQRIAVELERRFPAPSLFPARDAGLARLAVRWADALFRASLLVAIETGSRSWPEAFLADRKHLFPDVDFDAALRGTGAARATMRWHVSRLDEQLEDGRAFLTGDQPGLADIQVHPFIWMARAYFPAVAAELYAPFMRVAAWEARMRAIGEGARVRITAAEAFAVARAHESSARPDVDPDDPLGFAPGVAVNVAPEDTQRGGVSGELVVLTVDEVAVRRSSPEVGEVVVHFPRHGYRVTR